MNMRYFLLIAFVFGGLLVSAQQTAPDFSLKDTDGMEVNLSDYKGKVIYMSFWASWCGPCKKIFSNSKNIRTKLNEKGVVLLNISLDKDEWKWRDAIDYFDIGGIHLLDNVAKSTQFNYDVRSVPSFYIINKHGKLVTLTGSGVDSAMRDFDRWLSE